MKRVCCSAAGWSCYVKGLVYTMKTTTAVTSKTDLRVVGLNATIVVRKLCMGSRTHNNETKRIYFVARSTFIYVFGKRTANRILEIVLIDELICYTYY